MEFPPKTDPNKETSKITSFINKIFKDAGKTQAVIAASGGVDSSTALVLSAKALKPENLQVLFLPARSTDPIHLEHLREVLNVAKIPENNLSIIPVTAIIQKTWRLIKHYAPAETLKGKGSPNRKRLNSEAATTNRLRLANIAARARMIVIFDQAKLHNALVIGTENRSEHLLGYYTRFGDEASDLEPLRHLYKTQLVELAKHLKIPKEIITKPPTAGLWSGQTDEAELGFTYEEADPILYLHYEQQKSPREITKLLSGKPPRKTKEVKTFVKKVLDHCNNVAFKHNLPYTL